MAQVIEIEHADALSSTSKYPYAEWDFDQFNPIQTRLLDVYEGGANIAIAAATSAGKTVCAEMYMAYEVRERKGKSIYVGPLKALAKEKEEDWTDEGHHFHGLNVSIVTGDFRLTPKRVEELDNADVIVMTPEMLASRCRNQTSEKSNFLKQVGTVVFDESHLLTVPGRGDHIEVALMKLVDINPNVRIVLLSATMPNVDEICEWVSNLTRRDTYYLKSDYRPCPLNIHYETYYDGDRTYEEKELQKIGTACAIAEYYCDDKFLIFVHTKRTGRMMVEHLKRYGIEAEFHNADLTLKQRLELEKKFKGSGLRVIVATSTLAWGCYHQDARVLLPNGSLKTVADIKVGDDLLCPVGNGFSARPIIREKTFKSEKAYRVELESGEDVVVSLDHICMAAKGRSSPEWCEVSELSKGDFVATPADLKLWNGPLEIDWFWYLVGFIFGDGSLCDCGIHSDQSQKAVLDICLGKRDVHLVKVKSIFDSQFNYKSVVRDDVHGIPHLITKKKRIVDAFLEVLPLGRKNGDNDIPAQMMGEPSKIRSFLSGLFDADGGLEDHGNGNKSVGLSNISKKTIESVRTLLLGFGIRSTFGKKKVKGSMINGRYQPAVRDYSYRLRIFGESIRRFAECIGFQHPDKQEQLESYLHNKKPATGKDLLPARRLLQDHLTANNLTARDFREITKCDLWNAVNRQDCRRDTIGKLLLATSQRSSLNDLFDLPYYWSRIKNISLCEGGLFKEIEVGDPHAYVGGNVISHNCNLPARRVIITGLHRGLDVVENYDVWQMVGRAGRPRFDPVGDAYILVPESEKNFWITKLRKKSSIRSTLLDFVGNENNPHYKTLAFHVVSEIHYGNIKTKEGFREWFRESLAHHQDVGFDDTVIDRTIQLLLQYKAIRVEDEEYRCTPIGIIASMFYYSPFDVSDLRRNFSFVFDKGREGDDFAVAMALGNVDSHRWGVVSKHEREEMSSFEAKVTRMFGSNSFTASAVKTGYAYYNMLKGQKNLPAFAALQGALTVDLDRTMQVIRSVDQMSAKWDKKDWFKNLKLRLVYGVEPHLVELCQIPNIGQARAKRLHAKGIKTVDDVLCYDASALAKIMKCGAKLAEQAVEAARLIQLKDSIS